MPFALIEKIDLSDFIKCYCLNMMIIVFEFCSA